MYDEQQCSTVTEQKCYMYNAKECSTVSDKKCEAYLDQICKTLKVANAGDANGDYEYIPNIKVDWKPLKPVYKHKNMDKFIFWNVTWVIGSGEDLSPKIGSPKRK